MATRAEQARSARERDAATQHQHEREAAAAERAPDAHHEPKRHDARAERGKRDANLVLRSERAVSSPDQRAREAQADRARVRAGGR